MFKKITFIISAILFCVALVMPAKTDAVSVTPAIRELDLTAGQRTTAIIELENDSLEQVQLTTQVVNYTAKGETGEPDYALDSAPTGVATWIEVTNAPIVLDASEKTEIAVTFDTPSNASPGGYYAGVLFNLGDTAVTDGNADVVTIESVIAVPFLATVGGSYTESGKIAIFSTVGSETSYTEGPVAFNLRYQNTGDVHLKPSGKLTIKNMFGSTVTTLDINEDLGAVLPGTTRQYEVPSWSDLGNSFGSYTATVSLSYGTVTNTAEVSFWVISTLGIVIAVVVIIIIIFLIVLLVSKAGKGKKAVSADNN